MNGLAADFAFSGRIPSHQRLGLCAEDKFGQFSGTTGAGKAAVGSLAGGTRGWVKDFSMLIDAGVGLALGPGVEVP